MMIINDKILCETNSILNLTIQKSVQVSQITRIFSTNVHSKMNDVLLLIIVL